MLEDLLAREQADSGVDVAGAASFIWHILVRKAPLDLRTNLRTDLISRRRHLGVRDLGRQHRVPHRNGQVVEM